MSELYTAVEVGDLARVEAILRNQKKVLLTLRK